MAPYAKGGGFGDVLGALPQEVAKMGHDVRVAIPKYGLIEQKHIDGTFSKENQNLFAGLYNELVFGNGGFGDRYFLLRDFSVYLDASHRAAKDFTNTDVWNKKTISNVSKADFFK